MVDPRFWARAQSPASRPIWSRIRQRSSNPEYELGPITSARAPIRGSCPDYGLEFKVWPRIINPNTNPQPRLEPKSWTRGLIMDSSPKSFEYFHRSHMTSKGFPPNTYWPLVVHRPQPYQRSVPDLTCTLLLRTRRLHVLVLGRLGRLAPRITG